MEGGGCGGRTQALEIGEADANWELIRDKVRAAGVARGSPGAGPYGVARGGGVAGTPSLAAATMVIEERFGPAVVPVPFLADAASYDLLTVLVKKLQLGHGLLRRPRCLVPAGPLESLLQAGAGTQELSHGTREYSARERGESRYEETRLVGGALRHIRLSMAGVHKRVAFLALRPGAVALRADLPWLRAQRSIYVIHEVFYCGGLALAVTQGAEQRRFLREQPLPVAFCCLKIAVGGKGVLGSQKPGGRGLPARAAWLRTAVLERPPAAAPPGPALQGPCSGSAPGKWLFQRHRPVRGPSSTSLADPERHSMSLPLLQSNVADSDTEE
uniref:Chromosome 11 open reading frame 42 n=1 Tax=Varanus komodoensis TaxID=61221 RepID=A0A8D2LRM8_VARKO